MVSIIKVICVACIIGILAATCTPDPLASAADLPVQVTVDEAEFDAVFVPADWHEPYILAGDAFGERAF